MKSEMDKLKILLVDDDEDDRQFFADALEGIELNTDLHQLENGKSCMELYEIHENQ